MATQFFRNMDWHGEPLVLNEYLSGNKRLLGVIPTPAYIPKERRLFTATLLLNRGDHVVRMFHACYASSKAEVFDGLGQRMPAMYLGLVTVRSGIDVSDSIVHDLVPSRTLETLVAIGDCCPHRRPLEGGGVIHIDEGRG